MSSSTMHQPAAELVLNPGFHAKEISGPKRNSSSPVRTNQRHSVIVTFEQEGQYYCVKQDAKEGTPVKPGLLIEQNDGKQEDTANQETKLEFPESLKNARRNQDHKNRADSAPGGNRKIKDRQKLTCRLALHQFTMANHANGKECHAENANFN